MTSNAAARDAYQHRLGWRINAHLREERAMPDPSDLPYSDADVELVVSALKVRCAFCRSLPRTCPGHEGEARAVLRALAGRLLPEGAEPRTDYGMEYTFPGDDPVTVPAASREAAERTAESGNRTGYARHRVVQRTSWSTGWSAVPPEPKEGT